MAAPHGFELFPFDAAGFPSEENIPQLIAGGFGKKVTFEHADGRYNVVQREGGTGRRIFLNIACRAH